MVEHGGLGDSYSGIVQEALRYYLDAQEEVEAQDLADGTPVGVAVVPDSGVLSPRQDPEL